MGVHGSARSKAAGKQAKKRKLDKNAGPDGSLVGVDPATLTGRQRHQLKVVEKRAARAQEQDLREERRRIPKASKERNGKVERRELLSQIQQFKALRPVQKIIQQKTKVVAAAAAVAVGDVEQREGAPCDGEDARMS